MSAGCYKLREIGVLFFYSASEMMIARSAFPVHETSQCKEHKYTDAHSDLYIGVGIGMNVVICAI